MKVHIGFVGALLAVCAITAPAASAATSSCGYVGSPVFSPWGDLALYALPNGADFESGSGGWSWVNKAKVMSGDSNPLLGLGGSNAVEIPASGAAKSPWLCVDASTPSMRFFLKRVSGTGSLTVTGTLSGSKVVTTMATITGSSGWAVSPLVAFPDWAVTGTMKAQFLFTAAPGTVYRIDDVYLDPFKCC